MYCKECIYTNFWNDASLGINIIAKWDVVSFCQMPLEITTNRNNNKIATISSIYAFIGSHVLSECQIVLYLHKKFSSDEGKKKASDEGNVSTHFKRSPVINASVYSVYRETIKASNLIVHNE